MRRRFITRADIDALADAGQNELLVDDLTTVTDTAQERARDRGVRIVRTRGVAADGGAVARNGGGTAPATPPPEDLAASVRAAVIARLGHTPGELDAVLERVLNRG